VEEKYDWDLIANMMKEEVFIPLVTSGKNKETISK